jgi:hypothetical protein
MAVERIDELCDAVELGKIVVLSVRPQQTRVIDIVERGEECDVEVGQTKGGRVLGRQAERTAEYRVVGPDPILQKQREEAKCEGQVVTLLLAGEAGHERPEFPFEKQRLRRHAVFSNGSTARVQWEIARCLHPASLTASSRGTDSRQSRLDYCIAERAVWRRPSLGVPRYSRRHRRGSRNAFRSNQASGYAQACRLGPGPDRSSARLNT